MKQRHFCVLIFSVFLVCSGFVDYNLNGGGTTEVVIVIGKNTNDVLNISIPEKFTNEYGELIVPLVFSLMEKGLIKYEGTSETLTIALPDEKILLGTDTIIIRIEDFLCYKKINGN